MADDIRATQAKLEDVAVILESRKGETDVLRQVLSSMQQILQNHDDLLGAQVRLITDLKGTVDRHDDHLYGRDQGGGLLKLVIAHDRKLHWAYGAAAVISALCTALGWLVGSGRFFLVSR